MALTRWDSLIGGSSVATQVVLISDPPKQSYRVIGAGSGGGGVVITATVQLDPTSDDRFQRIMRVHLTGDLCVQQIAPEWGGCLTQEVYSNDLCSVWDVHLISAVSSGGLALPQVQLRFIQAMAGTQVKRATVVWKPGTTPGSQLGGIAQFHGWESNEFEIWGWIDPEVNGLVTCVLTFMVGIKTGPSSANDVIINTDLVAAIP